MSKTAINPTREQDYPEWYQQVISAAEMAENSPVRGCMVICPWGYAIWERLQQQLDKKLKQSGHHNAYFPLLIPLSYLEKEAEHVEGFAKECAVVTHHRLEAKDDGSLQPAGELDEPLIIRPTSETIIGEMMAKWIQSYRDLPLKLNQWANVMRWEMRTRLFLRTSEFLWQEGHTAHATDTEALEESKFILDLYADFAENFMAMPVIKGEKTISERFPGAINTYTIEAMMQDRKALQAGTSHFLGQNFSKAADMKFLDKDGTQQLCWTTSWGVSTRLIGGLIMTHADDNGMACPPTLAPYQIVIQPIYRNENEQELVLEYCEKIQKSLGKLQWQNEDLRIHIDKRDLRGGEKTWSWIKKGVPIRLEIGPKDMEKQAVCLRRRDQEPQQKEFMSLDDLLANMTRLLDQIQNGMLEKAQQNLDANLKQINSLDEFKQYFTPKNKNKPELNGGFAICYAKDTATLDDHLKPLKVSARCIPLEQDATTGKCIFSGVETNTKIIFARSY